MLSGKGCERGRAGRETSGTTSQALGFGEFFKTLFFKAVNFFLLSSEVWGRLRVAWWLRNNRDC